MLEIPKVKESAHCLSPSAAAVSEMIESESCEPTAPTQISPPIHAACAMEQNASDSLLKNLAANV